MTANANVFSTFGWINPPKKFEVRDGILEVKTDPGTDFWQRTHYGFQRFNGHAFLTAMPERFTMSVKTEFFPEDEYDQCGLFLYVDEDNWAKLSVEYETPELSRLGGVVTVLGYSDWATQDISSDITQMYYRVSRSNNDFLFENSINGDDFAQMRIFHLHGDLAKARVGVYACSPEESSFTARFLELSIRDSQWE